MTKETIYIPTVFSVDPAHSRYCHCLAPVPVPEPAFTLRYPQNLRDDEKEFAQRCVTCGRIVFPGMRMSLAA